MPQRQRDKKDARTDAHNSDGEGIETAQALIECRPVTFLIGIAVGKEEPIDGEQGDKKELDENAGQHLPNRFRRFCEIAVRKPFDVGLGGNRQQGSHERARKNL